MRNKNEIVVSQEPPYEARDLFIGRDKSQGEIGLSPVIVAEIEAIKTADEDLIRSRYLYAGTYVRGLGTASPYDHRDANYVNDKVRNSIIDRARQLGISEERIS